MLANLKIIFFFLLLLGGQACQDSTQRMPIGLSESDTASSEEANSSKSDAGPSAIQPGAHQLEVYLPQLEGKRIGMVVNQTSTLGNQHLVDTLLSHEVQILRIFAPEHGFRGTADAGEKVADGKDTRTGLPLVSLYGKKKQPDAKDLADIDLMLFDIQDVGARFYTYISTMHYVMEACAKHQIPLLILDRPNPNGHYVDGPVLLPTHQSFVGMHSVPIVHGMTIAEYARMINGEGWLTDEQVCDLSWVSCDQYDHQQFYQLPIKPSPNLPNARSIYLYPSLCLFEGTTVSVGRGTTTQFQVYGHPDAKTGDHRFQPQPMEGAKYPKHEGKVCHGVDLSQEALPKLQLTQLNLSYLLDFYRDFPNKDAFFLENGFFDKLAGGPELRQQIMANADEMTIRNSWQAALTDFKAIRKKYLLYKDFAER
ncbi:MAG: DUF1343 domain-containing protein [Bacteroidota bacterium]